MESRTPPKPYVVGLFPPTVIEDVDALGRHFTELVRSAADKLASEQIKASSRQIYYDPMLNRYVIEEK